MTPDSTPAGADGGGLFLELSARFLERELFPRIQACLRQLSPDDVWWRPNEASNSVGNLCLHLAGNLGQWVVSGVGEQPDTRRRQEEFDRRDHLSAEELDASLGRVVSRAAAVLRAFDPARLPERLTVQGHDVTFMEAAYHAVEHFSMHTGQIIWVTKTRLGRDLAFYDVRDGVAIRRW
ncbi:MAG TPA: DUF1572 family protein [Longimicrobiales bacterium]